MAGFDEDEVYIVEDEETPHWNEEAGQTDEEHLRKVTFTECNVKDVLSSPEVCCACMNTATAKADHAKWMMHFLWEKLRADLTLFSCFDAVLGTDKGKESLDKVKDGLKKQQDKATADKVAWLYSALVGNLSHAFTEGDVQEFVNLLDSSPCACSAEGKLDAVTNLLKSPVFRKQVWSMKPVKAIVQAIDQNAKPNQLYKCVFAFWMLSFDDEIMDGLKGTAVQSIKSFLSNEVKVEKVVRISLEVIDNFLSSTLSEDIATSGILEVIQALEYEKWRDQDLYARITELCKAVQSKVSEVSNFDRYLAELDSKQLKQGYLHQSKFWAENYNNDKLNKDVVEKLKNLVSKSDPESSALACNDLGEIAVLHKQGKAWVNETGAKDEVMKKMNHPDRNVRREALLCCQKIMLNKWQDITQK